MKVRRGCPTYEPPPLSCQARLGFSLGMIRSRCRVNSLLALGPLALAASLASIADGSIGHEMIGVTLASSRPPTNKLTWIRSRGLFSLNAGVESHGAPSLDKLTWLRGGVKKAVVSAEEDDGEALTEDEADVGSGPMSALKGVFANMPPATRVYVLLLLVITAIDVTTGEAIDAGTMFSMDWRRTLMGLELWRPLTSLVYLGPLSMTWLTNVYFLTQHGTRLELVSGTAEQVIFLLLVGILLLLLGPLIGIPFLSTSMVAAQTYVSSRIDPLGHVQFQFLRIPLWTLPFAQMGAAVLQAEGQPLAAIPHLFGILCGHVYHFFTVVHPLMGAKRRIGAPGWMKRRLDGGESPNFMEPPTDETASPKGRKIGAGKKADKSKRKLGKAPTRSKKDPSKSRPVPDFPTAGCA